MFINNIISNIINIIDSCDLVNVLIITPHQILNINWLNNNLDFSHFI